MKMEVKVIKERMLEMYGKQWKIKREKTNK